MNRLVLIGNGFDLAHDLDTSYKDFIKYLWRGIREQLYEQAKVRVLGYQSREFRFTDIENLLTININQITELIGVNRYSLYSSTSRAIELSKASISQNEILSFIEEIRPFCNYKNSFLGIITTNYLDKNWSDIEADYYAELKKCIDGRNKTLNKENVKKLNEDFSQIKKLLRDYLSNLKEPTIIREIDTHIYSAIKIKHIKSNRLKDVCDYLNAIIPTLDETSRIGFSSHFLERVGKFEEFKDKITPDYLRKEVHRFDEDSFTILAPEAIMFLNLNYTNTISQYQSEQSLNHFTRTQTHVETIQIHGTLASSEQMIFGYGDEEDQRYQELEMSEIPGLLDNVKSVNYLQSPNYRNLERFIESGPYQIFIMGMSCGLSDRTLLRKLFQHENCISIVPFYYEYMSEEGQEKVRKDNFNELSQNISRCFSNKDLLRSLVVDKTNCKPLVSISEKQ